MLIAPAIPATMRKLNRSHNTLATASLALLAAFIAPARAAYPDAQQVPAEVEKVAPQHAATSAHQPITAHERWRYYLRRSLWGPAVVFRAAGGAIGAQMNNDPAEWRQGMAGYSRRLANRFGRSAVRGSYEAAGAALLRHEVRYIPSGSSSFLTRAGHAFAANFVTLDRNGRMAPNVARVGSAIGAEFTANLWMPKGYRTKAEAMGRVGVELALGSAFNLLREFSPELRRIFSIK
jgi:hypothetical protein